MRRTVAVTVALVATWLSTCSLGCKREQPQARADAGALGQVPSAAASSTDAATAAGAHGDSGVASGGDAFRVIGPDGKAVQLRGSKRDIEEVSKIAAVYEMTELTENKQGCKTEGVTALEQRQAHRFVLLYRESGLVSPYLVSCKTIPECQALAATAKKGGNPSRPELAQGFDLVRGRRLSGAREEVGDWDFKEGCTNAFHGRANLSWNAEQVTVELRGYAFDYQRDEACNREEMLGQAKGKPCNRLIVIRAKRVASLM